MKKEIKEKILLSFLITILSNLSFGATYGPGGYFLIVNVTLLFLFIIFLPLKLILERKKKLIIIKVFNVVIFCILSAMIYMGFISYMSGYKPVCFGAMGCSPSGHDIKEVYLATLAFFIYLTSLLYKKIKSVLWYKIIKYMFLTLYSLSIFILFYNILIIISKYYVLF